MYQGFRLPNKLFNGVVDREEHDLIFSLPPPPRKLGGGERKKNPYMSSIFAWIYRTSNNFILCLQQKQPIGLLIFAYLGVLMTSLDPEHHWATNGWPQHIVAGVYSFLPHEYHPWLELHIKCVGWTPGTSTTP